MLILTFLAAIVVGTILLADDNFPGGNYAT